MKSFLEKIIEWGIYLFIFLLPWQTRLFLLEGNLNNGYWEYGTISVYATEILLWLVFLLTAIHLFKNIFSGQNCFKKGCVDINYNKLIKLTVFFFLFIFLSFIWTESRGVTALLALRFFEGVGLFLILKKFSFNWRNVSWIFITSAVIQAILGITQFLTQSTFASKWFGLALHDPSILGTIVVESASGRWLRAYGGLSHPNMLGAFLGVSTIITLFIYKKEKTTLNKFFLGLFFAILSFGLLTTFSKSAILATIITFIFLLITNFIYNNKNKINLLKFFLLFVLISIIFSTSFWDPVATRVVGNKRLEEKSTNERISYAKDSLKIIKGSPILGTGLGNYTLAVHNRTDSKRDPWRYQPVHNIYLLALAELGIIGFLIFLSLIIYLVYLSLQKNRGWYNILSIGFLVGIIGCFDHFFWTLYFGITLFWLCLALINSKKYFNN